MKARNFLFRGKLIYYCQWAAEFQFSTRTLAKSSSRVCMYPLVIFFQYSRNISIVTFRFRLFPKNKLLFLKLSLRCKNTVKAVLFCDFRNSIFYCLSVQLLKALKIFLFLDIFNKTNVTSLFRAESRTSVKLSKCIN